jgi:hypothetical protein
MANVELTKDERNLIEESLYAYSMVLGRHAEEVDDDAMMEEAISKTKTATEIVLKFAQSRDDVRQRING